MRIAVASDDAERVSWHVGRAPYYVVFTVVDGRVAGREVRAKAHDPAQAQSRDHGDSHEHGRAQRDDSSEARHAPMLEAIADCQVALAGGMCQSAYESLRAAGITVGFPRAERAEDAVGDYLAARKETWGWRS